MHFAAQHVYRKLPVSLDELLVDILYYLNKSSKWKQSLQYFQLLETAKKQSTPWLSLRHVIYRLIEWWKPVTGSFQSELGKSKPKKKVSASSARAKPSHVTWCTVQSLWHPPLEVQGYSDTAGSMSRTVAIQLIWHYTVMI